MCEDPVVEHGVKLSGFGHLYTYGNNITYECKIGYFMIGSYLIQCEENSTWNPAVPSCKQSKNEETVFFILLLCTTGMYPLLRNVTFYNVNEQGSLQWFSNFFDCWLF